MNRAAVGRKIAGVGEHEAAAGETVGANLERHLAARGSAPDPPQRAAAARLDRLAAELASFRAARQSTLRRLLVPPPVPRGVYLWGGVGRGKSLLMDAFYGAVAIRRKTRVHFHAFMRDTHEALASLKHEADPLARVADRIAKRHRLVCFDEFHVSDIADAMILGRLLEALLARGTVFVMTSNFRPDRLWPDGIQRERFLPAIALIERELDVIEVDGGVDYRLRTLSQARTWLVPPGAAADAELARSFEAMANGPDEDRRLAIEGRTIVARRRAGSAAWFDFASLCDGPRSQRDYLEIARRFSVVLLSGVPAMGPATADLARRFTWLVDILYDHRVKLIASAAVEADALYREGPASHEFPRTVSRLIEMRTRDYMAEPHASRDAAAAEAA
ncbi:MAG: cell division protein ZapE [Burkholderiales bacterium]|nr:cell division protein ZapE [Burkholderiales bacterium]MCE7876784.1 cell division protein ZapE [Betaproteobacteria bacterium PRO3]